MVWLLFVAFVVANEGIVVGDKTNHVATVHPTQVLYFLAFALAWNAAAESISLPQFLSFCTRNIVLITLSLVKAQYRALSQTSYVRAIGLISRQSELL